MNKSSERFVAFLRGINVGGNKPVTMTDLKSAFAAMNFQNIKTILASGNVLFEAPKHSTIALADKVEKHLKDYFGWEMGVIARTSQQIQDLAASQPFKKIRVTPQTRLYVTFLSAKSSGHLTAPWQSPDKGLRIIRVTDTEICSVLTLSPGSQTTDAMEILEKEFGKRVTTRNWNTIEKILKAAEA